MRTLRPAPLFLAALSLASLAATRAPQSGPADPQSVVVEHERLARLVELAESDRFYLLLEPEAKALKLMYQGALLREFPVSEIAVGRRRFLLVPLPSPRGWQESIWEAGSLDPAREVERLEITPPENSDERGAVAAIIPPTPEEAIPAPDRYRIRFRDRRSLAIVADAPAAARGKVPRFVRPVLERIGDLVLMLWPRSADEVRVLLVMPPDEAGALYRGVPDSTRFLILPPIQRQNATR